MAKLIPNIIQAEFDGETHAYVTFLPVADILKYGLVTEFIVGKLKPTADGGQLTADDITVDSLEVNNNFTQTLQEFCFTHMGHGGALKEEAKKRVAGHIHLIDQRSSNPQGDVLIEDIIGGFEVKDGKIISYHPNPKHQIITENGFFNLGESGNTTFERYLRRIIAEKANAK